MPLSTARDNNFDALRLLFALFVLVGHSYGLTKNTDGYAHLAIAGRTARVDVAILARLGLIGFFAISGYLVCGSCLSTPSAGRYLWKRCLRIWPAFLVVALLSVFVVGPAGSGDARAYFRDLDLVSTARAILTLHIPRNIAHAFPHNRNHQVNGPPWSLAVEFAMYLFLALLGVTGALRRRWPVALCWLGLAMLDAYIIHVRPAWAAIPRFAQGTLSDSIPLYLVFVGAAVLRLFPAFRTWALVAASLAMVVVGHLCGFGDACDGFVAPVLVVWLGALRLRWPHPKDDLSYGMYLNAWPIQQLLVAYTPVGPTLLSLATVAISAPIALLSWRFIERPALALKEIDSSRIFPGKPRPPAALR